MSWGGSGACSGGGWAGGGGRDSAGGLSGCVAPGLWRCGRWCRRGGWLLAAAGLRGVSGLGLAGGGAAVRGGERELWAQAGPRPGRAVEKDPAAEGFHAVL